eukprot:10279080-Prorocentrum_lima.AAC.1
MQDPPQEITSSEDEASEHIKKRPRTDEQQEEQPQNAPQRARGSQDRIPETPTRTATDTPHPET